MGCARWSPRSEHSRSCSMSSRRACANSGRPTARKAGAATCAERRRGCEMNVSGRSKAKRKSFRLGQRVTWASQSQGTLKSKTGKIVAVLEPHESPMAGVDRAIAGGARFGTPNVGGSGGRDHESYLVLVESDGNEHR